MRRTTWIGILTSGLLAVILCLSGRATAMAEDTSPKGDAETKRAPCDIALVDLSKILKEDKEFQLAILEMSAEVKETESKIDAERSRIAQREKELVNLTPGSDEYKKAADEVIDSKATFNGNMQKEKGRLMEAETAIYAKAYREIKQHIGDYARENHIRLVLRATLDNTEAKTRADVAKEMSAPVVFQDDLDITDEIIKRVNAAADEAVKKKLEKEKADKDEKKENKLDPYKDGDKENPAKEKPSKELAGAKTK